MPADITINEEGQAEMFSGQGIVPWHRMGTIVDGLLTSAEAIKAAHLDWGVEKRPLFTQLMVEDEETGKVSLENSEVPDYFAMARTDNDYVLSVVKGKYHPIPNVEAFDFFDAVVGEGLACYDTAGSLRGGQVVWMMAKIPGHLFIDTNPDDIIEKNVMLCTSHDGTHALSMQIVPTRVVCSNTLNIALREAKNQIKIRHTANYNKKMNEAKKVLKLVDGYYDDLQGVINIMAQKEMSKTGIEDFTKKLFPATEADKVSQRTIGIREKVTDLFFNGKGNNGRTNWDAFNAVTEYVDHHRGTRGADTDDEKVASRFESSLLGSGVAIKQRAMDLLTA